MNDTRAWSRRSLLPLAALAVSGSLGCGSAGSDALPATARSEKLRVTPTVSDADRAEVRGGATTFALDLYRDVEKTAPGNVVFSPASITTALAMTLAGARGETEAEMLAALRLPASQDRVHPTLNEMDAALRTRGEGKRGADGGPFRLRIVNATWVQTGETFLPSYLDTLAEHYGAAVNLLDFLNAAEPARMTINAHVARETEQKIKDLLPEGIVDASTRLVLTNAIYFNGAWRSGFTSTTNGQFTRADGTQVPVKMMAQTETLRAAEGAGWQAVELPYEDERLSLLAVVPPPGQFSAFDDAFDARTLEMIDMALQRREVRVHMPRFRFDLPLDLRKHLEALGMRQAFTAGADFSGMDGTRGLSIQAVVHKAFIAVAETGTEAAAATGVVAGRASTPGNVLPVSFDRPFLFFLRDAPTGAILFMGRVMDPSKTSGG